MLGKLSDLPATRNMATAIVPDRKNNARKPSQILTGVSSHQGFRANELANLA